MTYFTLKQIPDGRWGVHTLHLESGVIGGMFYYPTAERAFSAVTEAYKTPVLEVDAAAYRQAVQRSLIQVTAGEFLSAIARADVGREVAV